VIFVLIYYSLEDGYLNYFNIEDISPPPSTQSSVRGDQQPPLSAGDLHHGQLTWRSSQPIELAKYSLLCRQPTWHVMRKGDLWGNLALSDNRTNTFFCCLNCHFVSSYSNMARNPAQADMFAHISQLVVKS